MYAFALIRADLNSSESEIISQHRTQATAEKAANRFAGTTGEIGLYIAQRTTSGEWETRIESRDRTQRMGW